MKILERFIRWVVNAALDAIERRTGANPPREIAPPVKPEHMNGEWGDRTEPGISRRKP